MFRFDAELWLWTGDGAWHFVTVPADVSDEIEGCAAAGDRTTVVLELLDA